MHDGAMCEHLQPLENYLKAEKIPEIFRGASMVRQLQGMGLF
jgi:hypothetical protein